MSGGCVVSWHFSIQTEVFYCWRYGYVWGYVVSWPFSIQTEVFFLLEVWLCLGGVLCRGTSLYKLKCFIAGGMAMFGGCVVSWHFSIQTEMFYCWRYGYVWGCVVSWHFSIQQQWPS